MCIRDSAYDWVVLLGLGVARAVGVPRPKLLERARLESGESGESGGCTALVFPHQSGVSHFWNDPARADRAARELRAFLRDGPGIDFGAGAGPAAGSRSRKRRAAKARASVNDVGSPSGARDRDRGRD